VKKFFAFGFAVLFVCGAVFAQEYAAEGVLEFGGRRQRIHNEYDYACS